MTKKEFLERVYQESKGIELAIPVSVMMAQAALESAWGNSGLTKKANALFGIKAGLNWSGNTYNAKTQEVINGNTYNIRDNFRAYSSWRNSIIDHSMFLKGIYRYAKLQFISEPFKVCDELQIAGYATDPQYSQKLKDIIVNYNLTDYDYREIENVTYQPPNLKRCLEITNYVRNAITQLEYLEGTRSINYNENDKSRITTCRALINEIERLIDEEINNG